MRDAVGSVQSVLVLGAPPRSPSPPCAASSARAAARCSSPPQPRRLRQRRTSSVARAPRSTRWPSTPSTPPRGAVIDDAFARHGDLDVVLLAFRVLGGQAGSTPTRRMRSPRCRSTTSAASPPACVARSLRRQGHGTLVVLSSVAGERVRKTNFVYGSSKAGLDGIHGAWATAWSAPGPASSCAPGFVHPLTEGMDPAPLSTTPRWWPSASPTAWPTVPRWSGRRGRCASSCPACATCAPVWRKASDGAEPAPGDHHAVPADRRRAGGVPPGVARARPGGHHRPGLRRPPRGHAGLRGRPRRGRLRRGRAPCKRLATGESMVEDVSDGASRPPSRPALPATTDPADLAGFDVAVISVPAAGGAAPTSAFHRGDRPHPLAGHLPPAPRSCSRSTTYPGTTEGSSAPSWGGARTSSWAPTSHLGCSPGASTQAAQVDLRQHPKVVSGVDAASLAAVTRFYDTLVRRTVPVSGPREGGLASSSRHLPATSASPSSAGWPCSPTTSASTSGRPSTPPPPSPFGCLRFTPGPGVGVLPCHRPVLPVLAGAQLARARLPVRGTGQRRQRPHAGLRRAPPRRALNDRGPGGQGRRVLLLSLATSATRATRVPVGGRGPPAARPRRRRAPPTPRARRPPRRGGRAGREPRRRRSPPPTWWCCSSTTTPTSPGRGARQPRVGHPPPPPREPASSTCSGRPPPGRRRGAPSHGGHRGRP